MEAHVILMENFKWVWYGGQEWAYLSLLMSKKKRILQSELKTHAKSMKHMNKLICKSQNQKIMFHWVVVFVTNPDFLQKSHKIKNGFISFNASWPNLSNLTGFLRGQIFHKNW